jgi:hypothetical protein
MSQGGYSSLEFQKTHDQDQGRAAVLAPEAGGAVSSLPVPAHDKDGQLIHLEYERIKKSEDGQTRALPYGLYLLMLKVASSSTQGQKVEDMIAHLPVSLHLKKTVDAVACQQEPDTPSDKKPTSPTMVVHACNPSQSGGGGRRILLGQKCETLSEKQA